jgi:hypothetical protein
MGELSCVVEIRVASASLPERVGERIVQGGHWTASLTGFRGEAAKEVSNRATTTRNMEKHRKPASPRINAAEMSLRQFLPSKNRGTALILRFCSPKSRSMELVVLIDQRCEIGTRRWVWLASRSSRNEAAARGGCGAAHKVSSRFLLLDWAQRIQRCQYSCGSSPRSLQRNTGPSLHTYLLPTLHRPHLPTPHFILFSNVV